MHEMLARGCELRVSLPRSLQQAAVDGDASARALGSTSLRNDDLLIQR
jgi:hypothetical protein